MTMLGTTAPSVLFGLLTFSCANASFLNGQSGSGFRHQLAFSGHGGFEAPHISSGRVPFSMRALQEAGEMGGEEEAGADDDVRPAPPSVGADVPVTYFGVLNETAGTITLPIYYGVIEQPEGKKDAKTGSMFYVVTDTTDAANAAALGINHSPKLIYSNVGRGARKAYLDKDLVVHFKGGSVDFSPERELVAGDDAPFPPKVATAGSMGDEHYSPYFVLENAGGNVYNGPIVSMGASIEELQKYCDGIPAGQEAEARKILHDRVVNICPADDGLGGTVTLTLTPGFSFARPVFYLSMDASVETAATLEQATVAPGMTDIAVGVDDTLFSAVERIFITINGHTNADINSAGLEDGPGETSHPSRQGLNSAILGDGAPLNVLGGIPTIATDYSPAWDANLGEWTQYAIENGYRDRLLEEFQILGYVQRGFLTGPGGAAYGSASSNFIVNCPIVFRFL